MVATMSGVPVGADRDPGGDTLLAWAERSGNRRATKPCKGGLRFAFYGRVSTEDRQDPESRGCGKGIRRLRWSAGMGGSWRSISMWDRAGCCRGRVGRSLRRLSRRRRIRTAGSTPSWWGSMSGRMARITRALNDTGTPCPSAADPERNTHRSGQAWTLTTVRSILANPRYTGRQVWNRQPTAHDLIDPANTGLGHQQVQRRNLPDGWVISTRPAHPASARPTSSRLKTSAPHAVRPIRIGATGWPAC
jgi:Recombinase